MRLLLWIALLCVSMVSGTWVLPVLAGLLIAFCAQKRPRAHRRRGPAVGAPDPAARKRAATSG